MARIGYSTDVTPTPVFDAVLVEYAVPYTGSAPLSYAATVLGDRPVAYWRLGETTIEPAAEEVSRTTDGACFCSGTSGHPGAPTSDTDTAGRLLGQHELLGIRSGGSYAWVDAPAAASTGSWQHIVGTFDGTTFTLYATGSNWPSPPLRTGVG
ncbi:MAG TPA: LamG-like jellyroll fold domain-containing protein [Nitriliruptorales bacterium]|nr:LamG-like jellyroll fold domain-containing protein [Nitriliruptorales bacterium]